MKSKNMLQFEEYICNTEKKRNFTDLLNGGNQPSNVIQFHANQKFMFVSIRAERDFNSLNKNQLFFQNKKE